MPLAAGPMVGREDASGQMRKVKVVLALLFVVFLLISPSPFEQGETNFVAPGGSLPFRSGAGSDALMAGETAPEAKGRVHSAPVSRIARKADDDDDEDVEIIRRYQLVTPRFNPKVKRYEGYVYQRKHIVYSGAMRIRFDRLRIRGTHMPYYRIRVHRMRRTNQAMGKWSDDIGHWDPTLPVRDPEWFSLKADRACYWLSKGANPTGMVASLLDRAGIIRRTGAYPQCGDWEWRVPFGAGPDAPDGWSYDGPHEVTWNNQPDRKRKRKRRPTSPDTPVVERFGFIGYQRIPLDKDIIKLPVAGVPRMEQTKDLKIK